MRQMLAGRIMELGILLNGFEGIEAHVLLHGNTGCLCVEIYEDKSLAYGNRAFIVTESALLEIKQDMVKMHAEAVKSGRRYQR
ncbi:MAG: hypothetical protein HFG34_00455 [Eubacterium sp.]|nr:hypothetical protein [Eubacterium sp.]